MFGDPVDPQLLPDDIVIVWPHWQYAVKRSGVQHLRLCCNGSKALAPHFYTVASTWSSCAELSTHQLFLALCAENGLTIYGGDVTDAYTHSPAPDTMIFLFIDYAYIKWY